MITNTVFFGTHQFSIFALQVLKNNPNINLVAIVTTKDKKIGRKQVLTVNPVKKWAIENNVKVIEFNKSKDILEKLAPEKVELGIITYFGYLIPKPVINKFNKGILNIHPSLLPHYKGAAPLEWAIINGETTTGVTIIKINEEFDKGEIVVQKKLQLDYTKSKKEIYKNLFNKGAKLLQKTLDNYLKGKITLIPQGNSTKTAPKLTKENGFIDLLNTDTSLLQRKIMALNPWPGTYTTLQNIAKYYNQTPIKNPNLKIKLISLATQQHQTPQVRLNTLQPEGKNIMSLQEFKNGYLKN